MNTSRETIYSTLFALVCTAASFVTASRRMQVINQMQPSALPALFQQQVGEDVVQVRGIPPKYTLRVDIAVYACNPDPTASATPQLNALVDAVEASLAPRANGLQTLGGIVSHCFINGKIEVFEGNLGNMAAAVIPIEIVTN